MRNSPLRAFVKNSPAHKDNNPGGHKLRALTEKEKMTLKHGKQMGDTSGLTGLGDIKGVWKLGKKIYKKIIG